MKTFRLSIAFLLLAILLAVVPAALAQDETFGLSEADYQTWVAANANLGTLQSAGYDFTATFAVSGIEGSDVSADLSGTGVFSGGDNPMFQLALSGTISQGDETEDISVEVRVVNGIVYINDGSGWQGSSLDAAMAAFGEGFAQGSGMPVNPADFASGDLSALTGMEGMGDAMAALGDLQPSEFISLTRSDDVEGQAVFTLDFDLGGLLASPAIAPLLAGAMAGDTGEMTEAQLQQMGAMMGMMFGDASISFSEHVNASNQIVQLIFNLGLPLVNMFGPGAGISFNFDVSLSNINGPVVVEAPEGATMMDG